MTRVAGIDPGTVSFDLCGLDDGAVVVERSFETAAVGADPGILAAALAEHGPFELVYGPAGYGLPLVPAADVGERELALIVLVREDEPAGRVGVGGMRAIVRALIAAGLPLVFGPERSICRRFRRTASGTASTWGRRTRWRVPRCASPTRPIGSASASRTRPS